MRTQQFLEHHGIASNPFAEEDAQTDPVFKGHCIASTYHPTWDKIYGDPAEPATSIVFGEKGSGKTAMRLQIVRHLAAYNRPAPRQRRVRHRVRRLQSVPRRFRDRLCGRRRRPERVLAEWRLWDHMDAILSLGVTGLVDRILDVRAPDRRGRRRCRPDRRPRSLDRHQARDLLLLAACYDQSTAETPKGRWHRLRRKLRFPHFARTSTWRLPGCSTPPCWG